VNSRTKLKLLASFTGIDFLNHNVFNELNRLGNVTVSLFIPDAEGSSKSAERNITATVGLVVHAAGRGLVGHRIGCCGCPVVLHSFIKIGT
jgi:hypothetical protein